MTHDEFSESFSQLCNAFTVQKPENKSKIYFEKLERLSDSTFQKTCSFIIENEDKFPSILKLITVSRMFPDKYNQFSTHCDQCYGSGMVSMWRHGFRCVCLNGERISKMIALAPQSFEEKKAMYQILNQEHQKLYGEDKFLPREGKKAILNKPLDIVDKARALFGGTIVREIK